MANTDKESETVLLFGCKIRFIKLDPKRPSDTFDKNDPRWELQIYTNDENQQKEWVAKGLVPKLKLEESVPVWSCGLKKKVIKASGEKNAPVIVRDGGRNPLDPNLIGFGSTANIRCFKWPFTSPAGKKGIGFTLMELQVTKIIPYTPQEREEAFGETATEYEAVPMDTPDDSDY